jgi:hypothetical protein
VVAKYHPVVSVCDRSSQGRRAGENVMNTVVRIVTVIALVVLGPVSANAVSLGMIDTFQDGTTQGWFAGGLGVGANPPVPPHVVPTGGPAGLNDAFLLVTSGGGSGPGSRLVTINTSQWAGDYLGAAVPTIEMDLKNFGATELTLRLLFQQASGGSIIGVVVTNLGAVLTVGADWTHVVFSLDSSALTAIFPLGGVPGVLSHTSLLRVIHNTAVDDGADPVAGIVGIDNISAGFVQRPGPFAPIPEPTIVMLMGSALLAGATGVFALRGKNLGIRRG